MTSLEGLPLSYFAHTKPFDSLFARIAAQYGMSSAGDSANVRYDPKQGRRPTVATRALRLPEWVHHVRLTKFTTRFLPEIVDIQIGPDATRKPPRKEKPASGYEYLLEFSTDRDVRILLNQPMCTIAVFGPPGTRSGKDPAGKKPKFRDDLPIRGLRGEQSPREAVMSIRMILERNAGRLMELDIKGDLRFQLPRGLVSLLSRAGNKWVAAGNSVVSVPLDDATIYVKRGRRPRLSRPLDFAPETIVRIGRSTVVARLGKLAIGGSAKHPKLRFDDIDIITSAP